MSMLLRLSAAVSLLWAALLLVLQDHPLDAEQLLPVARGLANALAIAYVGLAYCFWYAARDPKVHRVGIYTAIIVMTFKMANAVYEILVLMPPQHALLSLADLVLSVGLLVGLLEALPRTFVAATPEP
jgi:hypothetical protein